MKTFINLDELEKRVKVLIKPTPQDVLNIIVQMNKELK